MRAINKLLGAAAAVAMMTAASAASSAVHIALQQDGGVINTVGTGAIFANFSGTYLDFDINEVNGIFLIDPLVLRSSSANVATLSGSHTLDVYVVRDNIAGPAPGSFFSGFTSNALTANWTITTETYFNAANDTVVAGAVTSDLGVLLGTANFGPLPTPGAQSANSFDASGGGAGPYSVTTRYTINASGNGVSDATISLVAGPIPEPATWALMILGFGSAGAMLRSRRRVASVAV